MLIPDHNLQLLAPDSVRLRPNGVILAHDLRVLDDPPQLPHDGLMDEGLLPDHDIVLVVGVVGVPQLAIRTELKLEELVAELALVADVIPQVEVVAHLELVLGPAKKHFNKLLFYRLNQFWAELL